MMHTADRGIPDVAVGAMAAVEVVMVEGEAKAVTVATVVTAVDRVVTVAAIKGEGPSESHECPAEPKPYKHDHG
jgi:hypothetical protein